MDIYSPLVSMLIQLKCDYRQSQMVHLLIAYVAACWSIYSSCTYNRFIYLFIYLFRVKRIMYNDGMYMHFEITFLQNQL